MIGRALVRTAAGLLATLIVAGGLHNGGSASAHTSVHIRVNQVGYVIGTPKQAFLMSETDLTGRPFNVLDASGASVFEGDIAASTGAWSSVWKKTHLADFSEFDEPGTYRVSFDGDTFSPTFRIGGARELYQGPLEDAVWFFGAQRDGPEVDPTKLNRQPSHLADAEAFVYKTSRFRKGQVTRPLRKIGGPIDVSGGWFDAGDYLKFVSQSSFVELLMLLALRDHQGVFPDPSDLDGEARFGLDWLDKMWDGDTGTLYIQMGIAHVTNRLRGDHDLWRLPQRDDRFRVRPGDRNYFVKHRPVFRAAAPRRPLSPNLAGRVAAAFALCSQVYRASDPVRAAACLSDARAVYAQAKVEDVRRLKSVVPARLYPEKEWRDDMELAAVELHFATEGEEAEAYLRDAARWANAYISAPTTDDPDVLWYSNVGGLAHAELARALQARPGTDVGISPARLLEELSEEIEVGIGAANDDPFSFGSYDGIPGAIGYAYEALLYNELSQTQRYADFVAMQLGYVFGANPWGTSFVVGAGSVFPFCLHHQIANLAGSLDGSGEVLRGATVYGPGSAQDFTDLGTPGGRACPSGGEDPFASFSGSGLRYMDDVNSWPSVEPAIDYTAATLVLLARFLDS